MARPSWVREITHIARPGDKVGPKATSKPASKPKKETVVSKPKEKSEEVPKPHPVVVPKPATVAKPTVKKTSDG